MAKFKPLPVAELAGCYRYDAETGLFFSLKSGKRAGFVDAHGSVILVPWFKGRRFQAHRVAWAFMHTDPLDLYVDHINGNRSDNRLANLRLATHSQNNHNMGVGERNTSGFKGVSYSRARGKWEAKVKLGGITHHFGRHETAELANIAAIAGRAVLHGEFSVEASR